MDILDIISSIATNEAAGPTGWLLVIWLIYSSFVTILNEISQLTETKKDDKFAAQLKRFTPSVKKLLTLIKFKKGK